MRKPTLCIDARMAYSSGIGTCIRNISPYLIKNFDVILLGDGKFEINGAKNFLFCAPIYSLKEQVEYPKKVPKCDLLWCPHYNVPFFKTLANAMVVTIHDAYHLRFGSKLERLYAHFMMKCAFKKGEAVITPSHFSAHELRFFFPKFQANVIHNGAQKEIDENDQSPEPYFLCVGNIKPHKNIFRLIKAFSKISGFTLKIVGKKDGLRNRENISATPPKNVEYLGEISNDSLRTAYKNAYGLIFPSYYEGFGLPPLEAMKYGCPVLASKEASIPEVCGDAALYFDPYDYQEIEKAIKKLIATPLLREDLIEKGRKRIQEFSWEKCAKMYEDLFFEVLSLV